MDKAEEILKGIEDRNVKTIERAKLLFVICLMAGIIPSYLKVMTSLSGLLVGCLFFYRFVFIKKPSEGGSKFG